MCVVHQNRLRDRAIRSTLYKGYARAECVTKNNNNNKQL